MDEDTDIYEALSPSTLLAVIGTVVAVAASVITRKIYDSSAPFFSAISVGVIFALFGMTWRLRDRKLLWLLIFIVASLHLIFVMLFPLPKSISYGIAFTPVVALDIFMFWKVIISILKLADVRHRRLDR